MSEIQTGDESGRSKGMNNTDPLAVQDAVIAALLDRLQEPEVQQRIVMAVVSAVSDALEVRL